MVIGMSFKQKQDTETNVSVSIHGSKSKFSVIKIKPEEKSSAWSPKPDKTNRKISKTPHRFDSSKVKALNYDMQNQTHYPQTAVKMGWEGKVVIKAVINSDGRADLIEILKSSSYDILDSAVLKMVQSWKYPKGNQAEQIRLTFLFSLE